jgi:ABC-type nitrate/sulfonate/bicarbonate transport system permease component
MRETLKTAAATAATFLALILLWQGAIRVFGLPAYMLPPPGEIGRALLQGWVGGSFWDHAAFTIRGALFGFALGSLLGVLAGVMVAEIRVASLAVYPLVIAIQSMPTVAVAPLIVVYLGVGLASKVATVALLCFFPVFVNTVAGIRAADPRLVDLYRAASATRLRLLLDVKLPGAMDHVMARPADRGRARLRGLRSIRVRRLHRRAGLHRQDLRQRPERGRDVRRDRLPRRDRRNGRLPRGAPSSAPGVLAPALTRTPC